MPDTSVCLNRVMLSHIRRERRIFMRMRGDTPVNDPDVSSGRKIKVLMVVHKAVCPPISFPIVKVDNAFKPHSLFSLTIPPSGA